MLGYGNLNAALAKTFFLAADAVSADLLNFPVEVIMSETSIT